MSDSAAPAPYLALLAVQTLAASLLFWLIFPVFREVLLHPGAAQILPLRFIAPVAGAVILLQACYWNRYLRVAICVPLHSPVVGHLLMFASRASFFFGGALFSAVFFRHVPQLDTLPPAGRGIVMAAGILAVLFALFCHALELERLGRAVEGDPPQQR